MEPCPRQGLEVPTTEPARADSDQNNHYYYATVGQPASGVSKPRVTVTGTLAGLGTTRTTGMTDSDVLSSWTKAWMIVTTVTRMSSNLVIQRL